MIKTFINRNGYTALVDSEKTYTVETVWTPSDGGIPVTERLTGITPEEMEMILKGQGYREANHG